jgi:hypothetical protein
MRPEAAQPTNRVLIQDTRPQTLGRPEETQREQGTQTRNARSPQDIQIQLNVVSNTNVINNPFQPPIDAEINTQVLQDGNNINIHTDAIIHPLEQDIQLAERVAENLGRLIQIKDHVVGAISFFILVYLFIKEQTRQP